MAPPAVNGVNGTKANGTQSSWQSRHNLHSNSPHFIGGNQLEKAPPSKVKDFVQNSDGHSVITSVRPPEPV
jgi:acetyl-CoA carboxylase / biotin carboxylase 1